MGIGRALPHIDRSSLQSPLGRCDNLGGNFNFQGSFKGAWLAGETLDNLERAHHYRNEAIHLRQLAETEENPKARDNLIGAAASYDKLYSKYLDLADAEKQRTEKR